MNCPHAEEREITRHSSELIIACFKHLIQLLDKQSSFLILLPDDQNWASDLHQVQFKSSGRLGEDTYDVVDEKVDMQKPEEKHQRKVL